MIGDVIEKASLVESKTSGIAVLGRGICIGDGKEVAAGDIVDKNI